MESIFIKPNNEVITIDDKDIYEFCKKECEKYVNISLENKLYFDNYCKKYTYFSVYYDFIIHHLKYIHKGYLLDKNKVVLNNYYNYYVLLENNSMKYEEIFNCKQNCEYFASANDENLDIQASYMIDTGFIDHEGILLGIKYFKLHEELARVLLYQLVIENNDIYKDYLKNKSIYSDYLINRLGFIKLGSLYDSSVVEYNCNLYTRKQYQIIYELKDYGCYDIERYSDNVEETKKFVLDFRRSYENRRI